MRYFGITFMTLFCATILAMFVFFNIHARTGWGVIGTGIGALIWMVLTATGVSILLDRDSS